MMKQFESDRTCEPSLPWLSLLFWQRFTDVLLMEKAPLTPGACTHTGEQPPGAKKNQQQNISMQITLYCVKILAGRPLHSAR